MLLVAEQSYKLFSSIHLTPGEYLHSSHPACHRENVGLCIFFLLLLCGHKCNKNSVIFGSYSSQKHVMLYIFECPSFGPLECEIQGNPCTFFCPQKGLNIPTTKRLSVLTVNVMGTWPGKAEGHCIIQLPIYWRQYI